MNLKIIRIDKWMAQGFISPVDRAINEIKQLGYEFSENPDYTLIQLNAVNNNTILNEIDKSTSPVIILECLNGTVVRWNEVLKHTKVMGYVKGQISKDNLYDKVHLGWNMALIWMEGNNYFNNQTFFDNKRDIDIHFSTVISDFDNWHLTRPSQISYFEHRMNAKNMIDMICKKYNLIQSGKCYGKEYLDKMRRSKVCVSPWGCGEICHRTFEAIRSGAIPICPDMEYMETWPNVIIPWETYVPCKHDFSDLDEIIIKIIDNYNDYKIIAENAYKIIKKAWENKVFANRFDKIIRGIRIK